MTLIPVINRTTIRSAFITFCVIGSSLATISAAAQSTGCDTYTLLEKLSVALAREYIVKKDLEWPTDFTTKRMAQTGSTYLDLAATDLEDFEGMLTSTACASLITQETLEYCTSKVSEAHSLDRYLENVFFRGAYAEENTNSVFLTSRATQLNLLGRAIELKKDCLQRLISDGIVTGNEIPGTTTPP